MLEPLKREKDEKKIISRLPTISEPDIIHGIRFYANGEPDVLQWEEFEIVPPPPGYARVRHTAITTGLLSTCTLDT